MNGDQGRLRHESRCAEARGSSPLDLDHAESFARDDFLGGPSNAAALALIDSWPDWPNRDRGPGRAGRLGQEPPRVDLGAGGGRALRRGARAAEADVPAALATGALVVEDRGRGALRRNRDVSSSQSRARGGGLRAAHGAHARRPDWTIADARPRVAAQGAAGVALAPPDDALLRAVLVKLFADRQLAVDEQPGRIRRDAHRALVRGRAGGGGGARPGGDAAASAP